MSRFFLVLISAMMVSAAFAGCFGEDDDGNDDPDDTNNPPPGSNGNNNTTDPGTNNTTQEPTIAPTPAFTVSMAMFDDEGAEASNETAQNFTASPGDNVTFTFDGSPSSDEDGEIEAHSWQVIAPDGVEYKASGPVLWFRIPDLKSAQFGVFAATLKVLDDDNVLNSAQFYLPLNYVNSFGLPTGMSGVGQATCDTTPNEEEAGSAVGDSGVAPGTYGIHKLTIGANASKLDLTLTYGGASPATELVMRVLPPGAADGACGEALGEASGGSPVSLSLTELTAAGQYIVRVDLDGLQVTSYSIEAAVTYTPPLQTTGDAAEPPAEEE